MLSHQLTFYQTQKKIEVKRVRNQREKNQRIQ